MMGVLPPRSSQSAGETVPLKRRMAVCSGKCSEETQAPSVLQENRTREVGNLHQTRATGPGFMLIKCVGVFKAATCRVRGTPSRKDSVLDGS